MEKNEILLETRNLKKYFPVEKDFFGKPTRWLHAVEDVSSLAYAFVFLIEENIFSFNFYNAHETVA